MIMRKRENWRPEATFFGSHARLCANPRASRWQQNTRLCALLAVGVQLAVDRRARARVAFYDKRRFSSWTNLRFERSRGTTVGGAHETPVDKAAQRRPRVSGEWQKHALRHIVSPQHNEPRRATHSAFRLRLVNQSRKRVFADDKQPTLQKLLDDAFAKPRRVSWANDTR